MFDVLRALGRDLRDSLRDLAPIVVVIAVFELLVLRQPAARLAPLAGGVVLVVIGLTLFIYGLKLALFPVGENLAHALARKGSVFWLIAFAFALGFGTTVAEPALIAVAAEAGKIAAAAGVIEASVESQNRYSGGLRITVALAVGVALVLGVMRIIAGWSLPAMIIGGYVLVVAMTLIAPPDIVGIAYDSGGVTTSTVTVPLVAALGVGLSRTIRGRDPLTDGFGLIALASLTPMIFVMLFGLIVH